MNEDRIVTPESIPTLRATERPGMRSLTVVATMVCLSDLTIFRAQGYAGPAAFFPLACVLLLVAFGRLQVSTAGLLTAALLFIAAGAMAWAGTTSQLLIAIWLLVAFAMSLHGLAPYLLESILFFASTIPGGYEFLHSIQLRWRRTVLDPVDRGQSSPWINVLLPVVSVALFSSIFVLANPDLIARVSTVWGDFYRTLELWFKRFTATEIVFWCGVAWFTAGLLRPLIRGPQQVSELTDASTPAVEENKLYTACRNTLVTLSLLYVVYLAFEFSTLWFRTFPKGFHYSGYAHQGAAWLTAALALATVMLSMIYRGTMIQHSGISHLQRLAWIWASLNFMLAISVYHRLFIYVDFNGMTRMRVVGLLGISSVIGGFILVLWKIARRRSFPWLIRHQLLVPAFAAYLYAIAPIDTLVHSYNVRQILAGHLEPSVQISEHPIDDAALPVLIPLLDCEDSTIRQGVRAILSFRRTELLSSEVSQNSQNQAAEHWTRWQLGIERAQQAMSAVKERLMKPTSTTEIQQARHSFHNYAMQWW